MHTPDDIRFYMPAPAATREELEAEVFELKEKVGKMRHTLRNVVLWFERNPTLRKPSFVDTARKHSRGA